MSIQTLNLSGTDELLERAGGPARHRPHLVAADDATLDKYASTFSFIPLWKLILLHSWVDCDLLGRSGFDALMDSDRIFTPELRRLLFGLPATTQQKLRRNAELAVHALKAGELKPAMPAEWIGQLGFDTRVRLTEFQAWSSRVQLPVVGPLPQRNQQEADWTVLRVPHPTRGLKLLQKVARQAQAEAADAWPTNERMSNLAVEAGASRNAADVIACLLRPDELPRGRRPRH